MMYNLRRHDALARGGGRGDYSTFERNKSPARRRSSASAPASRPPSPAPPSPSHAIILPARRGRIYLLIAGVAIFTPAVVAALFFITLVVLLLASSHFGGCGGQADYRGRAALAPSYHAANCYGIWSSWANICSLCRQDETVFARDLCLVKHIYGGSDQLNALAPTTRRVNSASPAPGEWTRRSPRPCSSGVRSAQQMEECPGCGRQVNDTSQPFPICQRCEPQSQHGATSYTHSHSVPNTGLRMDETAFQLTQ